MTRINVRQKIINLLLIAKNTENIINTTTVKNRLKSEGQLSRNFSSSANIKMLASEGPKGEPIVTPSI